MPGNYPPPAQDGAPSRGFGRSTIYHSWRQQIAVGRIFIQPPQFYPLFGKPSLSAKASNATSEIVRRVLSSLPSFGLVAFSSSCSQQVCTLTWGKPRRSRRGAGHGDLYGRRPHADVCGGHRRIRSIPENCRRDNHGSYLAGLTSSVCFTSTPDTGTSWSGSLSAWEARDFQRSIPVDDFHKTKAAIKTTATAKIFESTPRLSDRRTDSFTPNSPPATPQRTKMAATRQSTSPATA
jgi:hypothetical protein